jgi:SAM-dependent methyltransferase
LRGAGAGVSRRADPYERFVYPGYAYSATHPSRLEAIGRLFGLDVAPASAARVLELGCGDGANLLSMAQTLPGARFVGVDLAAGALARGAALAQAAGLSNVELRAADLEQLPADLGGAADDLEQLPADLGGAAGEFGEFGEFDYIVAHGVYSWVSPAARAALLECVRQRLAAAGVAFVSYNAYPGSHLRDMAREILRYHVRDIDDPDARLAAAHGLMRTIVAIDTPTPYARVLRDHMERMLNASDALLLHDDLAEISTPFYFHEFIEHARAHELRFVAEADLFESQLRDVPDSAAQLMSELPDDVLVREQHLDFFKNRMFRQTLLCHAAAPVRRELDDNQIERLAISAPVRAQQAERVVGESVGSEQAIGAQAVNEQVVGERAGSEQVIGAQAVNEQVVNEQATGQQAVGEQTFVTPDGFSVTSSEPLVKAALAELAAAWPAAVGFPALAARAIDAVGPGTDPELVRARLRDVLLQAHLARIVRLDGCAAPVGRPAADVARERADQRPRASALARAQHAAGAGVLSSLLHANVALDGELEPRLLALLDGTRTRRDLHAALGGSAAALDAALARLASIGLLHG